ncbi:Thioredoxin [bioreactor metagenome]|uniref:Thioredoxin n=1 Tax=bioreactor metagenome TaxID=1076179 RepID=A0A645JJE2_9ZZZZ
MIELTKENYEQEVKAGGVVFVDFWSPKCGPCMELLPEVHAWADQNEGRAKFCTLDTTGNKRMAMAQGVMGVPTFLFYKDGEKVAEFSKDDITMEAVKAKLEELLA